MSDGQVDFELSVRPSWDKARRVIPIVASALRIRSSARFRDDPDAGSREPHDPIARLLSGPSRARQLRREAW